MAGSNVSNRGDSSPIPFQRETHCVQTGGLPDETGGLNSPLYSSTAADYLDHQPVPYQRYFNTPNQAAVVTKVCALEGAEDGVLFSSGMAAISATMLALLRTGDHAVLQSELYGGTLALVAEQFDRLGIGYTIVAATSESIDAALSASTKLVFLESPSNPLLNIINLRQIAELCRSRGVTTIVDNTFATPILQRPIEWGIDVVVHSGTKYLGGHSDLQCGVAVTNHSLTRQIRRVACNFGGSLNAVSSHLLERSLKTLHLRMERQTQNAGQLAEFLQQHDSVERVYYPGLACHPGHDLAKQQMSGFGAMVSFELPADKVVDDRFLRQLRLIRPAVSLGGVESTICSPSRTSHAKVPKAQRQALGITDCLLRMSVGIEHIDDLQADLQQALTR